MDNLGILFALGIFAVYMGGVLLVSRFCSLNTRAEERQRRAEKTEVDGSWDAYLTSMQERKQRVDDIRNRWRDSA